MNLPQVFQGKLDLFKLSVNFLGCYNHYSNSLLTLALLKLSGLPTEVFLLVAKVIKPLESSFLLLCIPVIS